jgi:acetyltransferase-like isoleucine patch superfamily enzyme
VPDKPGPSEEAGVEAKIDDDVMLSYRSGREDIDELRLGPGAHLRSGTVLYAGSRIGAGLETGHNVIVREGTRIGDEVCLWSNTTVDYGCSIGNGVKIHCNCYVAQFTRIEDGAFLAPGVTIANDLYPGEAESADAMSGPLIGAGARIGANVTILPFVTIGAGAMVGAGAVVTRDIPEGMVAYGSPAVPRKMLEELISVSKRVEASSGEGRRFRLRKAPLQGNGTERSK